MEGEWRVVADGNAYYIGKVTSGPDGFEVSWDTPEARTKEELLKEWTAFNQALNKPIISTKGKVVDKPLVGKGLRTIDRCKGA